MIRMPFGKFRGKPVEELPSSYLVWLIESANNVPSDVIDVARGILADRLGLIVPIVPRRHVNNDSPAVILRFPLPGELPPARAVQRSLWS